MGDSIQLLVEKLIEGNAKMILLSKQMIQQALGLSEQIGRMREEIQKVKKIESESLQNLTNSEQSSEPSNRKLQSHKESMAGLDAAIEKKEAENRAANVKVNQVVAVDSPQLPELPNAEIERKESLQILFCPPIWKLPDAESRVVTFPTPPKPSESFESHLATTQGGFIGSFHSSLKQKEQPPPKPPDAVQSGTVLLRRVPPPKPPDLGARVGTVLLPRPLSKLPNACKPAIMTAIILVTAEESISGELMRFMSLSVEKNLEKVRVRWGINDAVRENGSMDKVGGAYS
ncbi:hypothetical protein A2U01_0013142 [Trifolium medium]|uniref:Uncharacterized protein n=1 Tax=Trifolium medium TaxID=97028 RepID=A0A392MXD5_9FABA|nr:hypothetical protein [Trifolium medium]